jgi:hypothetical protein
MDIYFRLPEWIGCHSRGDFPPIVTSQERGNEKGKKDRKLELLDTCVPKPVFGNEGKKLELPDKCVPKLELGNKKNEACYGGTMLFSSRPGA